MPVLTTASQRETYHQMYRYLTNVAMQEPRSGVVSSEADRHPICGVISDVYNVTLRWVNEVVARVPCTANHRENMTVKMHRVWSSDSAHRRDDNLDRLVSLKGID